MCVCVWSCSTINDLKLSYHSSFSYRKYQPVGLFLKKRVFIKRCMTYSSPCQGTLCGEEFRNHVEKVTSPGNSRTQDVLGNWDQTLKNLWTFICLLKLNLNVEPSEVHLSLFIWKMDYDKLLSHHWGTARVQCEARQPNSTRNTV